MANHPTPAAEPGPTREAWVDYAKAIGIVLVVYGHVARGVFNAGLPIDETFYRLADSMIYSFHMPLFFFIAGLFFVRSAAQRGRAGLVRSKVDTIVYPYIVWSLIQGGIEVALSNYTNGGATLSDVLSLLVTPRAQFWFLYVLFFVYVLAVLLYRRLSIAWAAGACTVAAVVFLAGMRSPDMLLANQLAHYFVFFAFGVLASYVPALPGRFSAVALAGAWFVAAQVLYHGVLGYRASAGAPLAMLAVALAGIALVVLLARWLARWPLPWFHDIGRNAMAIYLLHVLAASGCRIVLQKFLGVDAVAIHIIGGVLAGVLGPLMIVGLAERARFRVLFVPPAPLKLDHARA